MTALFYMLLGIFIGYAWIVLSGVLVLYRRGIFEALIFAMLWPLHLLICFLRQAEEAEDEEGDFY